MFEIVTIETPSLGDRSYVVSDGQTAVVIDPQRDIDRVLAPITARGLRVRYVLETHVHNDYVSGGLELAQRTGATYVIAAGDAVAFERITVEDGDVLEAGEMRLRVIHTPGHTFHHVSYALEDAAGAVQAVFTGGSMLYGSVGRTDLVAPEHTDELTRAQFASVRRLVEELPASADVFPTHGFGSFCSASPTSGERSTIGEEALVNPALTQDEQAFVEQLLDGLDAYPAYYVHMAPINRRGPNPVDLSLPQRVDAAELRPRVERGEWVVDLRQRRAFAAGHLAGSLGFELSDSFVSYLGWLYQYGTPLTLIGESEEQVSEARRELVRIGIDRLAGIASSDVLAGDAGLPMSSYRVADFATLVSELGRRDLHVLDTRSDGERAAGGVRGSQHIPLYELPKRLGEVPDGEVWVYCASGYRSSIAASILDRAGREVVLIDDNYEAARAAGLEEQPVGAR